MTPLTSRCRSAATPTSSVEPTCGLVSATGLIGFMDDPSAFYEPDRLTAQLLWFRVGTWNTGFPIASRPEPASSLLQLTAEICSEAPLHDLDWPSDITVWINGMPSATGPARPTSVVSADG